MNKNQEFGVLSSHHAKRKLLYSITHNGRKKSREKICQKETNSIVWCLANVCAHSQVCPGMGNKTINYDRISTDGLANGTIIASITMPRHLVIIVALFKTSRSVLTRTQKYSLYRYPRRSILVVEKITYSSLASFTCGVEEMVFLHSILTSVSSLTWFQSSPFFFSDFFFYHILTTCPNHISCCVSI